MKYEFKEITEGLIWKSFEENYHSFDSFFQSWEWTEFEKSMGKEVYRIGVYEGDNVVGVIGAVAVKAKRGNYIHVRNGPLIDWSNKEMVGDTLEYLKNLAAEKKCSHVRISPLLPESIESYALMKSLGLVNSQMHDVDAETCWVLDLNVDDAVLLANMRTNTRYHINRKRKENIEYEKSANVADLDKFWTIFSDTVKRQKWNAYSYDYLKKEFESFSAAGKAMFVFVNCDGVYVAGVIIIIHKGVAYRHHAASLSEYRKVAAPYLLEWEVIKELKSRGINTYNMMGIARTDDQSHPWSGLTFFKKGFGGRMEEHLHAHDFPIKKRYWLTHYYEFLNRKSKRF